MASHRHYLPRPKNHTHSWQQRPADIRGDLLQEHLGLTCTHFNLHPVSGRAQAPESIRTPGMWAYVTPVSPQAAEDIKATLSIQQPPNEATLLCRHTKTTTISSPNQEPSHWTPAPPPASEPEQRQAPSQGHQ